jgi:hypothetical protein
LHVYRDGDTIYVSRDHEGVLPEYIGEECAVHTAEGGTFLKVLSLGTVPNRYTLRSFNAGDMADVEVIWATPVSLRDAGEEGRSTHLGCEISHLVVDRV